jgi:adenylylsulfate kinase
MNNLINQKYNLSKSDRNKKYNHQSMVIWMTGLSGSGKSTLANILEQYLFEKGIKTFVLDGDNTRLGINKDLDFSDAGRRENIRRVAEIAKMMTEAGLVVITSFISPFISDRAQAKTIIGEENFTEVFVNCPLEVCEQRDVKGLYAKARNGEISNFTGISSAFEIPESPDITVDTDKNSLEECLQLLINKIENKLKL